VGKVILSTSNAQSEYMLSKLNDLLHQCRLDEINAIIGNFVSNQLSAKYIGRDDFVNILRFNNPVLVDMTDDFFEFLVRYCMYSNRIWASVRLIDIREKKCGITAAVKDLREDLLFFRSAVNDYDLKNPASSYEKALQLAEKYPNWDALIKLRLRLILYKGQGTPSDAEQLLQLAQNLYAADGEFTKYQLDFDRIMGKVFSLEEALRINAAIINSTRNGIIHLAVSEEMDAKISEYLGVIRGFLHSGDYENAAAWLELCRPLYRDDHLEKFKILQTELDILLAEQTAAENAEAGFRAKREKLKYVEEKIRKAEFEQGGWIDLYRRTLERSGYCDEAIQALLALHALADDYDAIMSAENAFPHSQDADMMLVHGRYLYALGKTHKAEEYYQNAFLTSPADSFVHYSAQRYLPSNINHGDFCEIGGSE